MMLQDEVVQYYVAELCEMMVDQVFQALVCHMIEHPLQKHHIQ
uniref:Uncharacterized protein n=1 Tax=Spodoptera exigua multiple nucleopolyhedrovirus TaxID=10454 RepID=A0A6N0C3T2_9ABAC|nr:hypothetical protein [Spodoptera exigua multiple nucleopolyhedrovirus]